MPKPHAARQVTSPRSSTEYIQDTLASKFCMRDQGGGVLEQASLGGGEIGSVVVVCLLTMSAECQAVLAEAVLALL
jgi:hypothetical protein